MEEPTVRIWPFFLVYLVVLIVTVAALRFLGRGWFGAIFAGLVLAGVLATLLMLLASYRRQPWDRR